MLAVCRGDGEYGGQVRHCPYTPQPYWHFSLTHGAVTIVSAEICFASRAPSLTALFTYFSIGVFFCMNVIHEARYQASPPWNR